MATPQTRLLFATEYLGRAVCTTDDDIQKYNWFCDMHRAALSISQIQSVRQIITETNQMISEFEVNVGSIPSSNILVDYSYQYQVPGTWYLVLVPGSQREYILEHVDYLESFYFRARRLSRKLLF